MNCIIDKTTKEVIWINPDPNRLSAEAVYGKFKAGTMQAVYCPGYQPTVGQIFKPTIANGTILEFQPKTVYNKSNMASRQLESWNDSMEENETMTEPKFDMIDGQKVYKRFQSFVKNDWVVDTEAEYEASIPKTLTPAQAEIILHRTGKLQAVEEILADPNTPVEAKIYWKKAQTIERDNTYLNTLATAIGLNKKQIDNLFIEGAKIK
jgi:hypothetical protein